jgi:outer membrane receptor protein involved in Fe transport
VLSTTLQANRRSGEDGSLSAYTELDANQMPTAQYDRLRNSDSDNWLADFALMFKRTITPQRHELSLEARFNHQDDADFTEHWREPLGSAVRSEAEINDIDALTKQFTAQIDYTRGLSDKTKLETGYKGNLRLLDRDYVVEKDPFGSGQYQPTDLSNALELDESVNAVYAVLSHSRKKFEYQAGLRAEYASRDFSLATTGESFPHDYTSLFPSGLINYKANDKTQIKLSYSRRIRRPGAQELNPFPSYFDLQNVFLGNPQLDPEYTDAIELGFQRSGALGTLQFSPFYRRTSDIIRVEINTADTLNGREVTSISFNNLDHSSSWGTDLNGQFKLGKAFSGLAAVNVFKMVTDGGSESSLQSNAVSWTFRTNGSLVVTPSTTLMGNFFYRAPMNFEQGKFSRFTNANFSVRQKLSGDKLSATLRVSDPFKKNTFNVRVGDDNIIQFTDRSFNARGLHLMMQYNFGQAPRLRQRRQEEQPQSASPFGQ